MNLRSTLRATGNPLALLVLGTAGATSVALHSTPVLAVGALSYVALVTWELMRPAPPPERRLPHPHDFADAGARDAIAALHRARTELAASLAATPTTVTSHLQASLRAVPPLEDHAVALARRAEELSDWLRTQDAEALRAELVRLENRAGSTRDGPAREEFQRARATRAAQIQAIDDIAGARDRIHAHLAQIVATLAGLPARLVRLRALDGQALDEMGSAFGEELADLSRDVALFESTLQSLATPRTS